MNKNRMSSVWFDKDGTPLSIEDIEPLLIDPNYKVVKQETLPNGLWISTVWTGFNYGYLLSGPPLIFETMVFSKEDPSCEDLDQARYPTEAAAIAGHEQMKAKWVKQTPPYEPYFKEGNE